MGSFFAPATSLMSRLKFPQRFALITALFLLPLAYALYSYVSTTTTQINFSQKEAYGTKYLRPSVALYHDLTEDYFLSLVALASNRASTPALQENQAKVDADFAAVAAVDSTYGADFNTTEAVNKLRASWETLKSSARNSTTMQDSYASIIASIRGLISTVGDKSNLILDPDLDSYYTMDAILIQLPSMWNTITDLSARVHSVLVTKTLGAAGKVSMTLLEGQVLKLDDNITNGANVAFSNNPYGNLKPAVEGPLNTSRDALNAYLSKLDLNVLQAPALALSTDSWLTQTRDTLSASYAQWDAQVAQLDVLLHNRISAFESARTLSLVVSFVALLLVVYMWVGFYRAVMLSVSNLEQTASMLASGNVSGAVTMSGKDEMSQRAAAAMSKMASATTQMNSAIEERTSELTEVSYLLAYMHDGVIITDGTGTIKVLNGTATRMLNTEYDEAISQPLLSFLRDPRLQETMRAAVAAPTQRFAVDVSINNRLVSVTVTFVTIDDTTTGLFVMQDVTELRTLQQQQQFVKASLVR